MERKSYHPSSQSRDQSSALDRRRTTWHPSQAIASKRQTQDKSPNVSPSRESLNELKLQQPNSSFNESTQQTIANSSTHQSIASGLDFEGESDDLIYRPSQVSIIEGSTESPTPSTHASQSELPIQSTREFTIDKLTINHEMNFSPYKSAHQSKSSSSNKQSMANPSNRQFIATKSTRQSFGVPNEGGASHHRSTHQSTVIPSIKKSMTSQSTRQSMGNDPMINSEVEPFDTEIWEDENKISQPPYASTRQSIANKSVRQSTTNQSAHQSMNNDVENIKKPHEYRSNHQSVIENNVYEDDGKNLQRKSPYRQTGQSTTEHSMQQLSNSPSTRQSMTKQSTQQSTIPTISSDPQKLSRDNLSPYRSTPQLMIDRSARQSVQPPSVSLSTQQSINYRSNQPSMTMNEDRNIWPSEEVYKPPYGSTRQSMADRSTRQSTGNKLVRPSTVHGYNMDAQIWNDTNPLDTTSPKSSRQSLATSSIRPSTANARISYARTLEGESEIRPSKSSRQSMGSKSARQSKSNSPSMGIEIFESDEGALTNPSNRQSVATRSTRQSTTNPSVQMSVASRSNPQFIANRSIWQSTTNESIRPSMGARSSHHPFVEEYDATRQQENPLNASPYQSNHQSMANKSVRQSSSNKLVQPQEFEDFDYGSNDFDNEISTYQPSLKSTRQSTANRSVRQSQASKSTRQSVGMTSMRPSGNDYQDVLFDDEYPQNQQPMGNQLIRQYTADNLETTPQMLDEEIYPSQISMEGISTHQSRGRSTRQSTGNKPIHQSTYDDPSIDFQMIDVEPQSMRQSMANRSSRQSEANKSTKPSIVNRQNINTQVFEDEIPQRQQSISNRYVRQSMANQSSGQSAATNLNSNGQMFDEKTYSNPISMEERSNRQSESMRSIGQSLGPRSSHHSPIEDPNFDFQTFDNEPQSARQSMTNKSARQSQGNRSTRQSLATRESMGNKSPRQSTRDRSTRQSVGDRSTRESTGQGLPFEPEFLEDEATMRDGPVPQSMENMSSHQSTIGNPYHNEMLQNEVHVIDSSNRSMRQSMGECQALRRSSFDEQVQTQLNEDELSRLVPYSGDQFEQSINNEKSRLNIKPINDVPIPSRLVTLEVRSNVQKESLDKFLVGGWDSVTLKIPPEMHSLLHGIRNSLSSDNSNLDLEQHMANIGEGNDGQCSANIRILYSGIYNSNQETTENDLYEQSQIPHNHSGSDNSNCPNCNTEREQGTVRFNIEES